MALRERLIYAIEIATDKAKGPLGDFTSSIKGADGVVAKFKAGAGSAFSSIAGNGALMATGIAGAAAAVGAFGAKAVMAFTETAKAAIDLSTSTGLNVEQSSRWIALGDDYQVTAEALATGLGKVSKTLDNEKWSKYGIATRDAGGKARDVNDILLDSFDMLSKVSNETERARIGQELFGKGYQSLTPLLGHTRAEYEKMLASQKEGQVITAEEAEKAEKTRLAMDELHDSLNEVTLAFGESLAPAVADALTDIAKLVNWAMKLKDGFDSIVGSIPGGDVFSKFLNPMNGLSNITDAVDTVGNTISGWFGKGGDAPEALDYTSSKAQDLIQSSIDLAEQEQTIGENRDKSRAQADAYVASLVAEHDAHANEIRILEGQRVARENETEMAERQRKASEDVADALDKERAASLRLIGGDIAIREAKRDAEAAYGEYLIAVRDGTIAKGEEQAAIDAVVTKYINEAQVIADNRITQMEANGETANAAVQQQVMRDALGETAAQLQGPLRDALLGQIAMLDEFERPRTANLTVRLPNGTYYSPNPGLARGGVGSVVIGAKGAIVRRPTAALIGEAGDEAVIPLDKLEGNSALPESLGRYGSSSTPVIEEHHHWHIGTLVHESQLGQLMNRAMTQWQRDGGRPTFTAKSD